MKKFVSKLDEFPTILFQMGLLASIGFVFIAFEWNNSTFHQAALPPSLPEPIYYSEIVPVTVRKQNAVELPKPPMPKFDVENMLNMSNDNGPEDIEMPIIDKPDDKVVLIPNITDAPYDDPAEVVDFFEIQDQPEFPGGQKAMLKFINGGIVYPTMDIDRGITGTVYISFVINKLGYVVDAKVMRPLSPTLDAEALRVVKSMPKWKPGNQSGYPVNVRMSIPIMFVLQ